MKKFNVTIIVTIFLLSGCITSNQREKDELRKILNGPHSSGHILRVLGESSPEYTVIISTQGLLELTNVTKNWMWVKIDGVNVALSKAESKSDIKKLFESNRRNIENINIPSGKTTMLFQGSEFSAATDTFKRFCNSTIDANKTYDMRLFITTEPHIENREACIIILNSLAINGLHLSYDAANNSWKESSSTTAINLVPKGK